MKQHRAPPAPPPTIASLKLMGVAGVIVTCTKCQNCKALVWEDVCARDDVAFPAVRARPFLCSGCGARDFAVMPDWSGYRPSGGGR